MWSQAVPHALVKSNQTDRVTLIVDFFDTGNPWYQVWSELLPDHMAFDAWAALLAVIWAALFVALTVVTLRQRRTCVNEYASRVLIDASQPQ